MMRKVQIILISLLVVFIFTVLAEAADSPVKVTISAQKEVVVLGKDKKPVVFYESVDKVKRDDVVIYTIVCENIGDELVKNVDITDPVPTGMVYIGGSATTGEERVSRILFSIDRGKTYNEPAKLTYKTIDAEGKTVEKQAPPEMYTHIKWVVGTLKPKEKISVAFKAKVL